MSKKLKNIIQEIFVEQKIDTLQKTEKEIKEFLGKGFIDKHINKMYLQKNNIIIGNLEKGKLMPVRMLGPIKEQNIDLIFS